jgi:hypothetical protein
MKKPIPAQVFVLMEALVFALIAIAVRDLVNQFMAWTGIPVAFTLLISLVALLALIGLAVYIDGKLTRFLRERGWLR